jgi:hypothetical protein
MPATSHRKRKAGTLPRSLTDRTTRWVISTELSTIRFTAWFRTLCVSSGFLAMPVILGPRFVPAGFVPAFFFAFAIAINPAPKRKRARFASRPSEFSVFLYS